MSEHTIASYRDTFRLVLRYAQTRLKKEPSLLTLEDVDSAFIRAFLKNLETDRGVSARSRNQRLAAIRSCFRYAALLFPEKSELIQQVLAIPNKRHERASIDYLSTDEIDSLLSAINRNTWAGRRDYILLLLAIRTGLRVSELTGLRAAEITLGAGAHIRCFGKGRKERLTPMTKTTADVLEKWLQERKKNRDDLVFTNARGGRLSTDGIQYILDKHVANAEKISSRLRTKRVTPHVLRHTSAMQLLQAGIDPMIIALWLGHESVETTNVYVEADMKMKEEALKKTADFGQQPARYQPTDELLEFLNAL